VEQFQYGKIPLAEDHRHPPSYLVAEEMSLIEYCHPASRLYPASDMYSPFLVMEDHFQFVFRHFSQPVMPPRST